MIMVKARGGMRHVEDVPEMRMLPQHLVGYIVSGPSKAVDLDEHLVWGINAGHRRANYYWFLGIESWTGRPCEAKRQVVSIR